jgi:hypothetical protein
VVNGVTYTATVNLYTFSVSPSTTTTYTVSSVSNNCGAGTVSGSAVVTVTVNPCPNQPDLVITAFNITKYAPNRVNYAVTVSNRGSVSASLGSVSLGLFASPDALRNANDVFKSALFAGGGNLAPNQTYTINDWVSFNFADANYYLAATIDYHTLLAECNEGNNDFVKLVNQCTASGNGVLSGVLTQPFYAYNGTVALANGTSTTGNTLVVGRSVSVPPAFTGTNFAIITGNCLSVAGQSSTTNTVEAIDIPQNGRVAFTENPPSVLQVVQEGAMLNVMLPHKSTEKIQIWNSTTREVVMEFMPNSAIQIDTRKLSKSEVYFVQYTTNQGIEARRLEW